MWYKAFWLLLSSGILASYPGSAGSVKQLDTVATHALGGGTVTRIEPTPAGTTIFVLSPDQKLFLVKLSPKGRVITKKRLTDPPNFLSTWPAHSPSEMMGLAVDRTLVAMPRGQVTRISTGKFGGLHVWNLRVTSPRGAYLVRVDQASERVVSETPILNPNGKRVGVGNNGYGK